MNYLMLDKNDITNVCGVISRKDVLKEISNNELTTILNLKGKCFRDKYILVEEVFKDLECEFRDILVYEGKRGYYYVNNHGDVFIIYKKSGKKRVLAKFIRKRSAYVKLGDLGDVAVKRLVAKFFLGAKDEEVVLNKNGKIFDCRADNLVIMSKSERGKVTGALSKSRPVGLFENGKMIKQWTSARKAAPDLFCSYQCVMEICNKKTKRPLFDVRWLDE